MSEYGRDESAPTPGGVFRGYFVGVRCIINNPFAAKWQAVSSCRGRFIVPVYTCSPYIRKTLGHIWQSVSNIIGRLSAAVGADLSRPHIGIHPQNDERKHVCGEMDMCICLCQNMGAMNRPLRLAECFVVISWVNVGCLQSVSWLFRGCSLHY